MVPPAPPAPPVPNPVPPGNTDHGIDSSVLSFAELPSVVFSVISSGSPLASVVVPVAASLSATVLAPDTSVEPSVVAAVEVLFAG